MGKTTAATNSSASAKSCETSATVVHLESILVCLPPIPPRLGGEEGEPDSQSPLELGDLGGEKDLYVDRSLKKGSDESVLLD
ncbi:MAG TPA: hypothetical protein V6D11_09425 [Waterburya sp.]